MKKKSEKLINEKIPELSIVLPCRNEELAISHCLEQIKEVIENNQLNAEIIVSDSSSDKSPKIAQDYGVKLVKHDKEGYGIACLEGFEHAKGKYIFMADCDASYDFNEIPNFLKCLKEDYELVIGNRFKGNIERGAMSFSHKYIGNPILSFILRVLFFTKIRDSQCGMRAVKRGTLDKLSLKTTGMEFASEMLIKALRNNSKIKELPVNYYKRKGNSKLKPFSDAWKHLRFMLLYSPLFLFFIPGLILFILGLNSMFIFYFGYIGILEIRFYYHPMFISSLLIILGYQLIFFAFFAKTYSITRLGEESKLMNKIYEYITIEKASLFGLILALSGIIIYLSIFFKWIKSGFPALNEIKNSLVALTLIVLGVQTIFSSFMLSILGIKEK